MLVYLCVGVCACLCLQLSKMDSYQNSTGNYYVNPLHKSHISLNQMEANDDLLKFKLPDFTQNFEDTNLVEQNLKIGKI